MGAGSSILAFVAVLTLGVSLIRVACAERIECRVRTARAFSRTDQRFRSIFDGPKRLWLHDTLVTRRWSGGLALIFPGSDVPFDMCDMDSCSCWTARGAIRQEPLGGE